MKSYNIPIVLFIFKRAEKSAIIIDQIAKIQPQKIYLIADGPRNKEEESQVQECRKTVVLSDHQTPCDIQHSKMTDKENPQIKCRNQQLLFHPGSFLF